MSHHPLVGRIGAIVVAVAVLGVSSRVGFPMAGSEVPQTAQTLAVVLAGAFLGSRDGAIALLAYLFAGAVGLPVFADGASGLARLYGPTAGYLAGFVVAAWSVGRAAERGLIGPIGPGFLVLLAAHAGILLLGGLWLARAVGVEAALREGVVPFIAGAILKSGVAAAGLALAWRRGWRPLARHAGEPHRDR